MHNPRTYIEFDPFKAKFNRAKHGGSFAQAEEALDDFMAVTIEDPDAFGEQRFVTLGADVNGRLLIVVYTMRGEYIRLISARKTRRRNEKISCAMITILPKEYAVWWG